MSGALERKSMFTLPVEYLNASRSLFDSQLKGANALWRTAFDSGASLLDLNVQATRAGLEAANAASSQLLQVSDAQQFVTLATVQSEQAVERAQRYGREWAGVASAVNSRFGQLGNDFAGSLPRTSIE
jgi:phasin family protein